MEDCAKRRTRPIIKNQHQKQKRRRDQVKSIIAAYVSGKVPLSKMMNPSRLTAPKNRNSEGDIRKADRGADLPKASTAATGRHKRKGANDASADSSLVEQKESAADPQELEKLWPAVQSRDQSADSPVASCKDDEAGGRDAQTCSSCFKNFSKGASTASSIKSLPTEVKAEATFVEGSAAFVKGPATFVKGPVTFVKGPATFVKGAATSFEVEAAAATGIRRQSEESTQEASTPTKQASLVSLEQSTPTLFDLHPFDYESFACYVTKKRPPCRHSAGPSLRWRTTSANFTKRQNLLELIKSHENVEQCLVKQIIHLRRERDKYRHAYIDLVKIHKILANRWFQFKKINID